jgi:RNA-binding protein YhbY
MIALLISSLLLAQTPARATANEAKPDAKKAPNTRYADGTGTARDGLSIQSPFILLKWPQVRKEIGLTGKQYDDVIRAVNAAEKQYHDELTRNLNERKLDMIGDAIIIIAAKRKALARGMATVMTPAQIRRLGEIALQIEGIHALVTDLELQRAINLSETQLENIKAAESRSMDESSRMSRERSVLKNDVIRGLGRPFTPEEAREFRTKNAAIFETHGQRELEAALIREINRQLTKRQRETFAKAKGKPFDVDGMMTPGSLERNEQKEADRKAQETKANDPDKAAAR